MRILTIDAGAIVGYAYGDPFGNSGPPFSGTFKLPDVQLTKRMIALEAWAMDMIQANGITDVFIEQNFIDSRKSSFDVVMALAGYVLFIGTAGSRLNRNVSTLELSTWRSGLGLPTRGPKNVLAHPDYARFKTGKRGNPNKNAQKDASRQWVKDRAREYAEKHGCTVADDNEADACCMWLYKRGQILERERARSEKTDLFDGLKI